MSKVKIELNLRGFRELYQSAIIEEVLQEAGDAVAMAAEQSTTSRAKYGASVHKADKMSIANVYPENADAYWANHKKNVLLKAIGAAGLPTKKPRL